MRRAPTRSSARSSTTASPVASERYTRSIDAGERRSNLREQPLGVRRAERRLVVRAQIARGRRRRPLEDLRRRRRVLRVAHGRGQVARRAGLVSARRSVPRSALASTVSPNGSVHSTRVLRAARSTRCSPSSSSTSQPCGGCRRRPSARFANAASATRPPAASARAAWCQGPTAAAMARATRSVAAKPPACRDPWGRRRPRGRRSVGGALGGGRCGRRSVSRSWTLSSIRPVSWDRYLKGSRSPVAHRQRDTQTRQSARIGTQERRGRVISVCHVVSSCDFPGDAPQATYRTFFRHPLLFIASPRFHGVWCRFDGGYFLCALLCT